MKKLTSSLIVFVFIFGLFVSVVSAQTTSSGPTNTTGSGPTNTTASGPSVAPAQNVNVTIDNPFGKTGANTLYDLFKIIINNVIIPIGGVVAVIAFIYSGFLYVMAQGDEKKIKNAHSALLYTAIGTAILLGAWVILNVITGTVNQLMS